MVDRSKKNDAVFVNIGPDDGVPLVVNIRNLVTVLDMKDRLIFYSTAGRFLEAATADVIKEHHQDQEKPHCIRTVLSDDWRERIQDAGGNLFKTQQPYCPGTEQERVYTSYINPAHVAYVTVSAPDEKNTQQDIVHYMLGLTDHIDRLESHGTPLSEVEDLIKEVEKVKGYKLSRILPDEGNADFFDPSYAVFDPQSVVSVVPNGPQIRVEMRGSGWPLCFDLPKIDTQQIFQQLLVGQPKLAEDFDKVSSLIYQEEERQRKSMHKDLSEKIAKLCPDLTEIPGSDQSFFTKLSDIETISYYQHRQGSADLNIVYSTEKRRPISGQYPQTHHVRFQDEKRALRVFNKISGADHAKDKRMKKHKHKNIRKYRGPKK